MNRGQATGPMPTLVLVVVALITICIGISVMNAATGPEVREYVNESAEWCDAHGGDLSNSRSFWHGGLHCELPNGSVVHMSEVVEPPQAA